MNLTRWKVALEKGGVSFAPGLSSSEAVAAEKSYGVRFPPDLRELLSYAVPQGEQFPQWRDLQSNWIQDALARPLSGICFDIEHNDFWFEDWGARPEQIEDALDIARARVAEAPRLIPIRGHRYLPDRPALPGNPIFSVVQTDIIHYGADLENYFHNEFSHCFGTPTHAVPDDVREIEFWSQLT